MAAEPILITDPRDGTEVGTVEQASAEQIEEALGRARAAAVEWRRADPSQWGGLVAAAADALEEHADELARLNESETGRPFEEALAGVMAGVDTLRQDAQLGPLHGGRRLRGAFGALDATLPEPRGVVLALTPWNDPVAVAVGLIGAALATGNVVVHKPSERCPHVGRRLGEIFGLLVPDGVVQTLDGGAAVGARLADSPLVDVIAHVGSTTTGRDLARRAAQTGAHLIRENGGKDPLIVDGDVDPVWAAGQAAVGAFSNSGQICTAVERIYVHRGLASPFLAALAAEARRRNEQGSVAPLVDRRMREAVARQVEEAVAAGARVLEGGAVPVGPGAHYPATVLSECTEDMVILREETFGPVAPVMVVDDFDEALRHATSGRYGLAATVLTASLAHAARAAAELPVGTVKVNAVFGGAPGGSAHPRGDSGEGIGYGPGLFDEFTRVKVVHLETAGGAS